MSYHGYKVTVYHDIYLSLCSDLVNSRYDEVRRDSIIYIIYIVTAACFQAFL